MALLTDGTISTLDDLRGYEEAILDVAGSERLDLSRKLVLAQQEIEVELTDFLLQQSPESLSHGAMWRPDLTKVVVTPALRQWHTFHTLALTYRDAYNSHLNDRYRGKWKEYERLARWALTKSFDTGIGMVYEPIAKAASPDLSSVTGNLMGATYWVRVAWTNGAGHEGCPSDPAVISVENGSGVLAAVKEPPAAAKGWNVYAGYGPDETTLQNSAPLEHGATWLTPDTGLQSGRKAGSGQDPDYFVRRTGVFQRG